jgi:hypothetical protein
VGIYGEKCQRIRPPRSSKHPAHLTFCFVCVPAPGHSTMISSLASVLVAKAKATPEKVVPYAACQQSPPPSRRAIATYKVYADDELRLAAVVPFNLRQTPPVQRVGLRRTVAVSLLLLLHWVTGWCGRLLLLLLLLLVLAVHVLLVLGRVSVSAAGVDGRRWHWAGGSALVRMRRAEVVALVGVLVRRWAAERLLWVHGE